MSSEESEVYKYQLEQVEMALAADPDNEELKKLQHDLQELIALTHQLEEQEQQVHSPKHSTSKGGRTAMTKNERSSAPVFALPTAASPSPDASPKPILKTQQFSVGQEVMARYAGDGQFYRAQITAIGGADQVFSVVFKGYNDNELVKAEDIKAIENKRKKGIFEDVTSRGGGAAAASGTGGGTSPTPAGAGSSGLGHKHKGESAQSGKAGAQPKKKKKVSEVEVKKNAWLNFATGADKKKMKGTPINKKSIFKTPDNPSSKGKETFPSVPTPKSGLNLIYALRLSVHIVGVVGSGRGMTSYQQRGKHLYKEGDEEE
ncbi:hypothetical protein BX666DRAFT_1974466 [Dichotomocladium elegans]|nr:hypothetical protein BX666DRAFT_1974466 [Dichotomocladium elegans]